MQTQESHEHEQPAAAKSARRRSAPTGATAEPAVANVAVASQPQVPAPSPDEALGALLQRCVEQRAALRAPVLQRYRRFSASPGVQTSDYRIISYDDPTFGKFHLKYHRAAGLDVFDELHVTFDDPKVAWYVDETRRSSYFFFRDDGSLIADKSWSGLNKLAPEAEVLARAKVLEFLSGSPVVADAEYQSELAAAVAKQDRQRLESDRLAEENERRKAEERARAEQLAKEQREAAERSVEETLHIKNFLADTGGSSGELPGFTAYIEGPEGAPFALPWLKKRADWYRTRRGQNWALTHELRIRKPKKPDEAQFRDAAGWPADGAVKVTRLSASGQYVNWRGELSFKNYTLFAKCASGKAEALASK